MHRSRRGTRSGIRLTFVSIFLGLLIGWSSAAWAQTAGTGSSSGEVLRVTVGEITGVPGGSVMVPLSFVPDPQRPLRSLTVELSYIGKFLTFEVALSGVVPPEPDLDVKSTVSEGKPDEKGQTPSTLRVTLSPTEAQASQVLPSGLLAFISFRISTEAQPSTIQLHSTLVAAEDARKSPLEVAKVNVRSGRINVELAGMEVPVGACFFYMH